MKTWSEAVKQAIASGAGASAASTLALLACGAAEHGRPVGPLNAVSHWIWEEEAVRRSRPSLKYTLLGYLVHHSAATFWAVLYEKYFSARHASTPQVVRDAAITTIVACVADFQLTPHRFTPGYERRLSKKSLFFVYGAFALGLAGATLLERHRRH
jgi:hypothetical protein